MTGDAHVGPWMWICQSTFPEFWRTPRELWNLQLFGCVESTPAVWHGMIYVGARGGYFYGIGDPKA